MTTSDPVPDLDHLTDDDGRPPVMAPRHDPQPPAVIDGYAMTMARLIEIRNTLAAYDTGQCDAQTACDLVAPIARALTEADCDAVYSLVLRASDVAARLTRAERKLTDVSAHADRMESRALVAESAVVDQLNGIPRSATLTCVIDAPGVVWVLTVVDSRGDETAGAVDIVDCDAPPLPGNVTSAMVADTLTGLGLPPPAALESRKAGRIWEVRW